MMIGRLQVEAEREEAQRALLDRMHCISEQEHAAGWAGDFEFPLWRRLQAPTTLESLDDQVTLLLAKMAGGWFVWDKERQEPRFIRWERWLGRFEEWERRR